MFRINTETLEAYEIKLNHIAKPIKIDTVKETDLKAKPSDTKAEKANNNHSTNLLVPHSSSPLHDQATAQQDLIQNWYARSFQQPNITQQPTYPTYFNGIAQFTDSTLMNPNDHANNMYQYAQFQTRSFINTPTNSDNQSINYNYNQLQTSPILFNSQQVKADDQQQQQPQHQVNYQANLPVYDNSNYAYNGYLNPTITYSTEYQAQQYPKSNGFKQRTSTTKDARHAPYLLGRNKSNNASEFSAAGPLDILIPSVSPR